MEEVNGNSVQTTEKAANPEVYPSHKPERDKGREVVYAHLHSSVFLPGPVLGNLKETLGPKVYPGMRCWYNGTSLEVAYKGEEFAVPAANVKIVHYKK